MHRIKRKERLLKSFIDELESLIYIIIRTSNKRSHYSLANVLRNTNVVRKSFITIFLKLVSRKSSAISSTKIIKESIVIVTKASTKLLIATKALSKLSIIESFVDSRFELSTKYEFYNYTYVKAFVFLSKNAMLEKSCLNNNVDLIIFNREFFKI